MRNATRFVLLVLICMVLPACGDKPGLAPGDNGNNDDGGLALTQKTLVSATNDFAFKLFKEIVKDRPDSNVIASPLSVSMALGMTANGAAGTTRDAMLATLGFDGYSLASADECYQALIKLLTGLDPKVTFRIANSFWGRESIGFQESFLERCRTYFHSEVRELDLNREDAADTVNTWVEEKTNGKIRDIVAKPIDPKTIALLVNAIYFLGPWEYPFDPLYTRGDSFTLPNGSRVPCMMMTKLAVPAGYGDDFMLRYAYLSNDLFQAVDLPYGGGWFSMTILLPKPGKSVDSVISALDRDSWDTWQEDFSTRLGEVLMPRFRVEYACALNDALRRLGMGIAFDPGSADFSEMCTADMFIDEVLHKTYLKVDEAGTEAAAATVVIGAGASPDTSTSFWMKVDRPFLFFIRDRYEGAILFTGKVVNPGS
ncbi:MAG: serpin family protein [Candidatus Eisenbacteria bacterium]